MCLGKKKGLGTLFVDSRVKTLTLPRFKASHDSTSVSSQSDAFSNCNMVVLLIIVKVSRLVVQIQLIIELTVFRHKIRNGWTDLDVNWYILRTCYKFMFSLCVYKKICLFSYSSRIDSVENCYIVRYDFANATLYILCLSSDVVKNKENKNLNISSYLIINIFI